MKLSHCLESSPSTNIMLYIELMKLGCYYLGPLADMAKLIDFRGWYRWGKMADISKIS